MTEQEVPSGGACSGAGVDGRYVPRIGTVEAVELDHQVVLLAEATGTVLGLSPVATVVWRCIDGRSTVDEIAADLSDAFGADLERVRTDVIRFVGELARNALLEGRRPPGQCQEPEHLKLEGNVQHVITHLVGVGTELDAEVGGNLIDGPASVEALPDHGGHRAELAASVFRPAHEHRRTVDIESDD